MKQEYVGCRAPWYIYWHWCQLLKPKVKLLKLLGSLEASQIQSYLLPPWLEAFKCLNRCHWQCTGWFTVMITGQDIIWRTHSQTGTVCLLKLTWYDNLWIDLLRLRPFSPIIRVSGICVAWQCALGYCVVSLSVSSVSQGWQSNTEPPSEEGEAAAHLPWAMNKVREQINVLALAIKWPYL